MAETDYTYLSVTKARHDEDLRWDTNEWQRPLKDPMPILLRCEKFPAQGVVLPQNKKTQKISIFSCMPFAKMGSTNKIAKRK